MPGDYFRSSRTRDQAPTGAYDVCGLRCLVFAQAGGRGAELLLQEPRERELQERPRAHAHQRRAHVRATAT